MPVENELVGNELVGDDTWYAIHNGMRVKELSTSRVYLVLDNVLRHIPDPATFDRLFRNWQNIVEMRDLRGKGYEIGPAIPADAELRTHNNSVFLVMGGVKRWVVSPMAMDQYWFNWDRRPAISDAEVQRLQTGNPIHLDFPGDGVRVTADFQHFTNWVTNRTYMAFGGKLRRISYEINQRMYRDNDNILDFRQFTQPQLVFGDDMPANTALKVLPGARDIYVVMGGERRRIVSPEVFNDRRFNGDAIGTIAADEHTVQGPTIGNSDIVG